MGTVDTSPDWALVESSHLAGIKQAKDTVWRFMGVLPRANGHRTWCVSPRCLPPELLLRVDEAPAKLEKLLTPVYLGAERLPPNKPARVFLGQCERCGWVYWGVSQ